MFIMLISTNTSVCLTSGSIICVLLILVFCQFQLKGNIGTRSFHISLKEYRYMFISYKSKGI